MPETRWRPVNFVCNIRDTTSIVTFSLIHMQLRNVHQKLEADLISSKERLRELLEKKDELMKGREESVSVLEPMISQFIAFGLLIK